MNYTVYRHLQAPCKQPYLGATVSERVFARVVEQLAPVCVCVCVCVIQVLTARCLPSLKSVTHAVWNRYGEHFLTHCIAPALNPNIRRAYAAVL